MTFIQSGPPPFAGAGRFQGGNPIEHIQSKLDSGELDVAKLRSRVESKFGAEAAAEVFGEDGSVNLEKLQELHQSRRAEGAGPSGNGFGGRGPGDIDPEALLAKVESKFGSEAASEITNEDGSINFEALKELFSAALAEKTDNAEFVDLVI